MNSQKVAYSKGANDECYTPAYGVAPIIKHIDMPTWWKIRHNGRKPIIWCPFDTEQSQFVIQLRKAGYKVIASHIDTGQDFYTWEPSEHWDIIISNPPFTNKRGIFDRALSFGKPFALLMSLTWLNDAAPKQLFMDIDLQLLMFDKRIKYGQGNKITFSSAYYCRDFLQKQIIMEHLPY